jgi:pyrroline-5-carboxylate reductase
VRSERSANRVCETLEALRAAASASSTTIEFPEVQVLQDENKLVILQSDIIILGCKPYDFERALAATDVRDALLASTGTKALVSILGAVSTSQLVGLHSSQWELWTSDKFGNHQNYSQYRGTDNR